MKWWLVLLLVIPIGWKVAQLNDAPAVQRPNIILVIADDLGQQLGTYGDPNARTPNIDKIAAEGTQFNAGYVTAASCSPSRGSIFTGLYPHQHGMMGLSQFGTQRMLDNVPKLPNELKKLGYRTAIIGKRHYEPESLFDWDVEEEDYEEMFSDRNVLAMSKRAVDFIDDGDEGEPFFLVVSYVDPHRGGSDDGVNYGRNRNTKFPKLKSGLPENATPPSQIEPFPFLGLDSPAIREELADFYGAVDRLDIGVGALRAELEKRGLWEDAYVIFVGDHGPDVTRGKMAVYESATRIPFLLKTPGKNQGFVREELVSTIDIFPTLMDAATGNARQPYQGRSLLPLAKSAPPPTWRRYMFSEYITHGPGQFYPRYAVRDERYKLIYNVLGRKAANPLGPRNYCNAWWEAQTDKYKDTAIRRVYFRVEHPPRVELYDLENDPHEWNNLAGAADFAATKDRLMSALQDWRQYTNDPLLDPAEFQREAVKGLAHD
ncbi:MAG: sulfatase [Halioglobus sp.]|nr:sulfatase [Halioglobus sp.]